MILGIDYAGVDVGRFESVEPAKTGAKFAYIRSSGSLHTDPTWSRDRGRWASAGIPAGPYHWFNFHADPAAQARTFIDVVGARAPGELPPALDLEADSAASLRMTPQACLAAAEACLAALQQHYGCVVIYTSARVWADVFHNLPSSLMARCPLWIKIPYAWRARNPPHLDGVPTTYGLPTPWKPPLMGRAWMVQFQGDAIGLPGTTSTVDLNRFEPRLQYDGVSDVRAFQRAHGLVADGVIGPRTFAALTQS